MPLNGPHVSLGLCRHVVLLPVGSRAISQLPLNSICRGHLMRSTRVPPRDLSGDGQMQGALECMSQCGSYNS